MSCAQNELLTSAMLLNKEVRDRVIPISEKLQTLNWIKSISTDVEKKIADLEDELSQIMMENVLAWWSTTQAKVALLDKFSKSFSKYWDTAQIERAKRLSKIDSADLSRTWNIARQITQYLPLNQTRDEVFWAAKNSLEKWLIFDYLNIPESSTTLYKKLVSDWVITSSNNQQKDIRKYLWSLKKTELDSLLKWNKVYDALSYWSKSETIDNFLAYSAIMWGNRDEIVSIMSAIKKSDIEIWTSDIIKALKSVSSITEFKDFVLRNTDQLKDAIDELILKREQLVSWVLTDEQRLVKDLSPYIDPETWILQPEVVLTNLQKTKYALETKMRSLSAIVTDARWEALLKWVWISEEEIKSLLWIEKLDEFQEELDRLIQDQIDIFKYNESPIKEKLKSELTKLDKEKADLRAKWEDVTSISSKIKEKEAEINSLYYWNPWAAVWLQDFWQKIAKIKEVRDNLWNTFLRDDNGWSILWYLSRWKFEYNKWDGIDMSTVAFLKQDRWTQAAWLDATIWDLYSQAYKANSIDIWDVQVFDSIEDLKKELNKKNSNISNIVVSNYDDYDKSKDIVDFIGWYPDVWFLFPKSQTLIWWFTVEWNRLRYSSYRADYISNLKKELLDIWISNELVKSWEPMSIAQDILNKKNSLQKVEIDRAMEELWISDQYTINEISTKLSTITKINNNITQAIIDPLEIKKELLNKPENIRPRLKWSIVSLVQESWLSNTSDQIDSILNWMSIDEMANRYISITYWRSLEDIANWEIDLLWLMNKDFDSNAIVSATQKNAQRFNAITEVSKSYNLPYKIDYNELIRKIESWESLSDAELWQIRKDNPSLVDNNAVVSVFEKAINEAKLNTIPNIKIEWWKSLHFVKDNWVYDWNKVPMPSNFSDHMVEQWAQELIKRNDYLKWKYKSILEEYYKDVIYSFWKDWKISEVEAARMKNKVVKSLRAVELEQQKALVLPARTFIFWVPSITDANSSKFFQEQIDWLAYRYSVELDRATVDYSNLLKWEKDFTWLPWVPVSVWWKLEFVSNWELIDDAIDALPDWLEELNILKWADFNKLWYSNTWQWDMLNAIKETAKIVPQKEWIAEMILRKADPQVALEMPLRKNVSVQIWSRFSYLPAILVNNRSSEVFKAKIPSDLDLSIKEKIYQDVSDVLKSWKELSIEDVRSFSESAVVNSVSWLENIEQVINSYASDFVFYTRLVNITDSMIDDVKKFMNPNNNLSDQAREMVWNMNFTDIYWNTEKLVNKIDNINYDYPDILYRWQEQPKISNVWGRDLTLPENKVEREDLKRWISRQIDMIENWFIIEDWMEDWLWRNIRNNWSQALKMTPRWKRMLDIWITTIETWRVWAAEISKMSDPLSWAIQWLEYAFIKSENLDPKRLSLVWAAYEEYMKMTTKQFLDVIWENAENIANLTDEQISAYKIAQHFRTIKERVKDISIDKQFNEELQNWYDELMSNITEVDDSWKVVFREWKKWHMQNLERAMNRGNIFYWLDAFWDRRMFYKVNKRVIWFDDFWDAEWAKNFNELFNTDYWINDYRVIMWTLLWDMWNSKFWVDRLDKPYAWLNIVRRILASPALRFVSSFPWTILSWITSSVWYFKTIETYAKSNLDFDMKWASEFMRWSWILTSTWWDFANVLFNADRLNPIQGLYEELPKIFWRPVWNSELALQIADNGQNMMDWAFANTMKVNSFAASLKSEWFISVDDFKNFINNQKIPLEYRRNVYDNVVRKTYETHEWMINYVWSDFTKKMDDWSSYSKLLWFMNRVINPINFRWSLWMNYIANSADNLNKMIQYAQRYWLTSEVIDAIVKDPVLKNWIFSWIRDWIMALKTANLNNQWESSNEARFDIWDFTQMFKTLSQNYQIINTAWPMRVIQAWMGEDQYPAAAALSQYAQNFMREMTAAATIAEMAVVMWYWGEWDFSAYLENNYEKRSTWWLRYQLWSIPWVVTSRWAWVDSIFWWENELINLYYWKSLPELDTRMWRLFQDWSTWEEPRDFFKSLLWVNKIYRSLDMLNRASKWKYEFSLNDPTSLLGDISSTEVYKDFATNWKMTNFDWISKEQRQYILKSMKLNFVPWGKERTEAVDNFKKTWKFQKLANNTKYYITEKDWMWTVLWFLQEDWLLDSLRQEAWTTNDQKRTQKEISNYMIDYINTLSPERKAQIWSPDWLMIKISNTASFDEYKSNMEDARQKSNKRMNERWRMVEWTVWPDITAAIETQFIKENAWAIQDIYSDSTLTWQRFSNLWLERTLYRYAKDKWVLSEDNEYFNTDTDNEWNVIVWELKPKWKQAIWKINYFQKWIKSWKSLEDMADTVYWVFSIFPSQTRTWDGDKKTYDTEIMTKAAMYMNDYARSINIPEDRRIEMITANMAFLWDKILPLNEIRDKIWNEFADAYSEHLYQSYKDAVKLAHDSIESGAGSKWKWGKWGKWWSWGRWGRSINVWKFASDLSKFKKYVDENAWDIYKPFALRWTTISPYSLAWETVQQRSLQRPEIPSYNAKSKKLFSNVKAKKLAIPETSKKTKKFKFNIKSWTKNSKKK